MKHRPLAPTHSACTHESTKQKRGKNAEEGNIVGFTNFDSEKESVEGPNMSHAVNHTAGNINIGRFVKTSKVVQNV